jgi:hypothetical protein
MAVTPTRTVHICACDICQAGADETVLALHRKMNVFMSRLTEPQRRWYAGTLSQQADGPTEAALSRILGLDVKTIRRGRRELQSDLTDRPLTRQRLPGGGRRRAQKKTRI